MTRGLLQRIQRGANLLIRWTLAVIGLNLGPGDSSSLVDDINRRMRNAIDPLAFVCRIAQSVGIDNLMIRVGKERKTNCSFAIRGDLPNKVFTHIRRVHADRIQLYVLPLLQQRP